MNTKLFLAALLAVTYSSPRAFAARITQDGQQRCGVVELGSRRSLGGLGPSSASVSYLRVGKRLYEVVVSDDQWPADAAQKNQRARSIIDRLEEGQRLCLNGEVSDVDGTDPMNDGTGIWIFPSSMSSKSLVNPPADAGPGLAQENTFEDANSAL